MKKFYDEYYDFYVTIKGDLTEKPDKTIKADLAVCSKYVGKSGDEKKSTGKTKLDEVSEDILKYAEAQHENPHTFSDITEDEIKNLGKLLFNDLFVGEIVTDFRKAFDETDNEDVGLRILLDIAPNLTWFPWEIARYDEKFLATEIKTPFLRIFTGKTEAINLEESRMPRVLSVLSNLEVTSGVDVDKERTNLKGIILKENSLNFGGYEDVKPQPSAESSNPSLSDIETVLDNTRRNPEVAPFNIVHFLGHGEFDEEKDLSAIILQPTFDQKHVEGKERIVVSGKELVEKIGDERSIGLIVLNACSTGRILGNSSGLVPELLKISSAVVAMRKEIGKDMAREFTIQFYKNFTPQNAEVAIQTARKKLHTTNGKTLDFSIPVLYLGCNEKTRIPANRIFRKTMASASPWTPATHLNPAGVIVQALLELHDASFDAEKSWTQWLFADDKDLKLSKQMPSNLLRKQLFPKFDESLLKTSVLICTTFSHAVETWKERKGCLDSSMARLVEVAKRGGEQTEIRSIINDIQQEYKHVETLICHIVTTGKEVK